MPTLYPLPPNMYPFGKQKKIPFTSPARFMKIEVEWGDGGGVGNVGFSH